MSAASAHLVIGRMEPDAFARALHRAAEFARGGLDDVTEDELPLLRYLAAVCKHLDVVREQLAAGPAASLNPA